jgi:hypothetical protein
MVMAQATPTHPEVWGIELSSSAGLIHKITAGQIAEVPFGNGAIKLLVTWYRQAPSDVTVQLQPVDGTAADAAPWQVERRDPPVRVTSESEAVTFRLHGGQPGRYAVALEAPGRTPVRFTLDVMGVPVVRRDHQDQVLRLGVGDCFLLDLDFAYMHEVRLLSPPDAAMIRLLRDTGDAGRPGPGDPLVRDIHLQHEYQAVGAGQTNFRLYADSGCGKVNPPCLRPDSLFRLQVEVR